MEPSGGVQPAVSRGHEKIPSAMGHTGQAGGTAPRGRNGGRTVPPDSGGKQRLIKEGKIKKEKPLPEITEDGAPFEIPESWKWVQLQDIALVIVDCPHSTPQYLDIDIGYYAIGTKCMNSRGEITKLFNIDKLSKISSQSGSCNINRTCIADRFLINRSSKVHMLH